jgi:hypothetical protein
MAATPSPAYHGFVLRRQDETGDVYVVKLDAKGNLQWTKTIGGPDG